MSILKSTADSKQYSVTNSKEENANMATDAIMHTDKKSSIRTIDFVKNFVLFIPLCFLRIKETRKLFHS